VLIKFVGVKIQKVC